MAQHGTAPSIRHALPRGVYSQPYLSGRVHFTVRSDGLEGVWRLKQEWETEDDVIVALADDLDATDRQPQRLSASPRVRAPHLHLLV